MASIRLPAADSPAGESVRVLRDQLAATDVPTVLILDFLDLVLGASGPVGPNASPDVQVLIETLACFPTDRALERHRVVAIDRSGGLDPRLLRFPGWEVLRVEIPDEQARTRFAERIVRRHEEEPETIGGLDPTLTSTELGRISGGLLLDDLMRAAHGSAHGAAAIDRGTIKRSKDERIRQRHVGGLEVLAPSKGFAGVAGLPQIKLAVRTRRQAGVWSRSMVLAGPAGVGKTYSVSAIADELGWPAVSFANVRSMWLGESERNIRDVLAIVRAMAPVVFHIDEADQVMGRRDTGRSGDSGTGARILAELWRFLGDSAGNSVLAVLTTNRPDLFDPATLDRSEVIPVLHPTPSEQVELLRLECASLGYTIEETSAQAALGRHDLGLVTGRMLSRVAQRAALIANQASMPLAEEHLDAALDGLLERVDAAEHERMALKALELTSFESYLPWVAARELRLPVEVPAYVGPLLDGARLDRQRLTERIAELDARASAVSLGRAA